MYTSTNPENFGSLIGAALVVASIIGLTAGSIPASAAPQQSPGVTLGIGAGDLCANSEVISADL